MQFMLILLVSFHQCHQAMHYVDAAFEGSKCRRVGEPLKNMLEQTYVDILA